MKRTCLAAVNQIEQRLCRRLRKRKKKEKIGCENEKKAQPNRFRPSPETKQIELNVTW